MPNKAKELPELNATPRADFLPPRIRELHDGRKNRHNLAIASLSVASLCAIATMLANAQLFAAETRLSMAETQTSEILTQQSHYSDIIELIRDSANLKAAYAVVSEKEVDYGKLLRQVKKALPAGARLNELSLVSPSSTESPTNKAPLTGQDILVSAKVGMNVNNFQDVEFFLLDARQWAGYSNATITGMTKREKGYTATVVVNLDLGALMKPGPTISATSLGEGN